MAWTAVLYTFSKRINSSKLPSGGASYSCTSNEPLDVLAPRLRFNLPGGATANPSAYNYCYVQSFGRYYWIDKWIFVDGLWTAQCSVDPLASWRSEIRGSTKYILRAAAYANGNPVTNGYYIDNKYPSKSEPDIIDFTQSTPWVGLANTSNSYFIIGIIGKGATRYYGASLANMANLLNIVLDDNFYTEFLNVLGLSTLYPEAKIAVNPLQYISSIRWYPFPIPGSWLTDPVPYGPITIPMVGTGSVQLSPLPTMTPITGTITWNKMTLVNFGHPDAAARGAWLNNAPWSSYHLFVPPWGIIPLDSGVVCGVDQIKAAWSVDVASGLGVLDVYGFVAGDGYTVHLCRAVSQIGVDFPVANIQTPGYGLASFMSTVLGVAGSVMSGKGDPYLAAAGGIANAVGDAIAGQVPRLSMVSSVGSSSALYGTPALQAVYYRPAPEDIAENGRPVMQLATVSDYSGFMQVSDGEVAAAAYPEELNAISGYLTGGWFNE